MLYVYVYEKGSLRSERRGSFRKQARRTVCSSQTEKRSRPVRHEWPTVFPQRCGAPVPQLQMDRTMGRPVALRASRIRS